MDIREMKGLTNSRPEPFLDIPISSIYIQQIINNCIDTKKIRVMGRRNCVSMLLRLHSKKNQNY